MAHKDIRIEFELGGEPFEAVGYLNAGEVSVLGEEALRRADNGHLVRSNADWRFVYEHRSELLWELGQYWLATARSHLFHPRRVSDLNHGDTGWYSFWLSLGGQWDRGGLVLRRRTSPTLP